MKTNEAVRDRIFRLCQEHDMTINRLATVSALPPSSIKNILYGKSRNPKLLTIKLICDGLGITLGQFFTAPEFDNLEQELHRKLGCEAVIHMDPVVTDDGLTGPLRSRVAELVKQVDPAITIHDFRVVAGPTHTNLVFDAVVPFDEKLTAAQAAEKIRALVRTMDDGRYFAVVTVENSYI